MLIKINHFIKRTWVLSITARINSKKYFKYSKITFTNLNKS
jgi:hypothetical protein